jgi:hypothetical protein
MEQQTMSDAEIEAALRDGEPYATLSLRCGLSVYALRTRRWRLRIARRGNRLYPLNEAAFALPLSPAAEYWAGMLITDGCVSDGVIKIALAEVDERHLAEFRAWIGGPPLRREGKAAAFVWAAFSRRLEADLGALGIVARKTASAAAEHILAASPDFWRGVIDGDGWISKRGVNRDSLRLYGAQPLLQQFSDWHGHIGPAVRHRTIFMVRLEGERARDVLRRLYLRDGPALARKRQRALDAINNPRAGKLGPAPR